ncbi:MAG TPA: hypothetical protein VM032_01270 [Vicinamibacterales bacterium]|nr:hypothetical protein [Vicinamibacterales bacterium]
MTNQHSTPQEPHGHGHTHAPSPASRHPHHHDTRGPLPIVVGVTGHRDLRPEDLSALSSSVTRILQEVREAHPHTPLLLLSPLAEGSDRLVARVALDIGVRLVVPLPLPQELYEQDFSSDGSRAEFRQLLARAESSYVLPLMKGNTADGIRDHGEQRNRQYAQVGALIARLSQVFLALWDGRTGAGHDDKVGGTGEVVRFRLEGVPTRYEPAANPLTLSSSGPVYHIVAPRAGQPLPDRALTHTLLMPTRQTAASFEELQGWMDQFNSDALEFREQMAAQRASSKAQLLQVKEEALSDAVFALPHSARITLERYAVADTLAVYFAGLTRSATRKMFSWVFISALFFNLFHSLPHGHLPEHPSLQERLIAMPWLLLAFLGASIIASYWISRDVEEQDYQNKHQDYRALAEALRIQFFWHVAGVPENVVDHYLRKQRGALEWIRSALRAWDAESLAYESTEAAAPVTSAQLSYVAQHWVSEQRNYYASKARREQATLEAEERKIDLLVRVSVALALLLAVVLTVPLLVPIHALESIKHIVEEPWTHGIIMIVIVTLAVTAGLRHSYNQQMARSEHAKQFGRMAELFDTAEQHLTSQLKDGEMAHATALLKELGQEALEENGDWVMLHRERPLEVPHSG